MEWIVLLEGEEERAGEWEEQRADAVEGMKDR